MQPSFHAGKPSSPELFRQTFGEAKARAVSLVTVLQDCEGEECPQTGQQM